MLASSDPYAPGPGKGLPNPEEVERLGSDGNNCKDYSPGLRVILAVILLFPNILYTYSPGLDRFLGLAFGQQHGSASGLRAG